MVPQPRDHQPEAVPLSEWTVLIVDDEQLIRDLLQSVLEDAGYTVLTACDGGMARSPANCSSTSCLPT